MNRSPNFKDIVEDIFRLIPDLAEFHRRDDRLYILLNKIIRRYFQDYKKDVLDTVPLDGIVWPHMSLGNITSYNFFYLDEILLYIFYWHNRSRYRIAFDIGANTGIDSIIMSRCGYDVYSFEPDPLLYEIMLKNIQLNNSNSINAYQKAVSNKRGVVDFVRVKGNAAANHILHARDFYGDAEYIKVETMLFSDIGVKPDLMKINVEGYEKYIVPTIDYGVWEKADTFIEVHDRENAEVIFDYLSGCNVNIFSQKIAWQKVKKLSEMTLNNKEGYIFVSKKDQMPWKAVREGDLVNT